LTQVAKGAASKINVLQVVDAKPPRPRGMKQDTYAVLCARIERLERAAKWVCPAHLGDERAQLM
jgi:hypothetical protein